MSNSNRLNNVNVDLNAVPMERCKCGNGTWKIVYLIKKVSALMAPSGKETIVPIQVFSCDKCSTLSPLFKNLNDTDEIPQSEGASLEGSVVSSEEAPPPTNTSKIFVG